MPDEPPWEWVEGDRAKAALFRSVSFILLALSCVVLVGDILPMLNLPGLGPGPFIPLWLESILLLLLAFGVLFLIIFPTQYPIVRRLGISPIGIRLGLPLRMRTVKWSAVKWVGPNYVDLGTVFGNQPVRLTLKQVQRISRFLQSR